MPSQALLALHSALDEVRVLQKVNPSPEAGGGLTRPQVTRAIGRAQVILLCSHYERYLRALNEEAVECVLAAAPTASVIPLGLKLLHARSAIDHLFEMQWDHREDALREYSEKEAALWDERSAVGFLCHERIVVGMKSPKCDPVLKFFHLWGIHDIFSAITRKPTTRKALWLRLGELVDKRNNIAHGDPTVEATYLDVSRYLNAVSTFCERADRRMGAQVSAILGGAAGW